MAVDIINSLEKSKTTDLVYALQAKSPVHGLLDRETCDSWVLILCFPLTQYLEKLYLMLWSRALMRCFVPALSAGKLQMHMEPYRCEKLNSIAKSITKRFHNGTYINAYADSLILPKLKKSFVKVFIPNHEWIFSIEMLCLQKQKYWKK